jgi:hypothetical protein
VKRNSWSTDERVEYDILCDEAWSYSTSTRERTERFIEMLRDADQAHRFYATDCLDDALHWGAAAQLNAWKTRQKIGRIAVSYEGKVLNARRIRGTIVRDDDGNPMHTQCLFDYFTWEQLEAKALEYATNIRAYKVNLDTVSHLLELRDLAPGTNTPDEATKQLGVSVEEFLMGETAA